MEKSNILSADLLDILFDGRNKNYGAYQLRKTYPTRVRYALAGTFVFCLLFTAASILANARKKTMYQYGPMIELPDMENITPKDDIKPKQKPKPIVRAAQPREMIQNVVPVITKDDKVTPDNTVKTIDELNVASHFGNETVKGPVIDVMEPPAVETGSAQVVEPVETETGTILISQIPAHFPGGVNGWRKYLERNLNKDLPSENGAPAGTYSVTISFLVDRNGAISDVKAENDPGYGTREEAIKVIQKSPNWSPAEQNGKKVIYRQKQSITFRVAIE